ncbi:hypothetical protein FACS1894211_08560 [Clostridia bacterium]|nr:hypothetical protein FACS1894211_08560 [Clostridia bacterium]
MAVILCAAFAFVARLNAPERFDAPWVAAADDVVDDNILGEGTAAKPFLLSKTQHMLALQGLYNVATTGVAYDGYAAYFVDLPSQALADVREAIRAPGAVFGMTASVVVTMTSTDMTVTAAQANGFQIGASAYPFAGVFDGGNKTLTVAQSTAANIGGVFGYTAGTQANPAVVKNLTVAGSLTCTTATVIGGLIGQASGYTTADNVTVAATVAKTGATNLAYIGGIIGTGTGPADVTTVKDCTVSGNITTTAATVAATRTGGVIGRSIGTTTVDRATVPAGTVIAAYFYAGGIIGDDNIATNVTTVQNCTVNGTVQVTNTGYIGGLIYSSAASALTVKGNTVGGTVAGTPAAGVPYTAGLIAQFNYENNTAAAAVEISGNTVSAAIKGTTYAAGLISTANIYGLARVFTISNNTVSSAITVTGTPTGGLIANLNGGTVNLSGNTFSGTITGGTTYVGACIGQAPAVAAPGALALQIDGFTMTAAAQIAGTSYVGGVIGGSAADVNSLIKITNGKVFGRITGTGTNVAGLAGLVQAKLELLHNTVNTPTALGGTNYVAGLVGHLNYTSAAFTVTVSDNEVTGGGISATGTNVGGLFGAITSLDGKTINIDNARVSADVITSNATVSTGNGGSFAGGFIGYHAYGSTVNITNSTFSGAVKAAGSAVGGIVGYVFGNNATYHSVFNLDNVTVSAASVIEGQYYAGGIFGYTYRYNDFTLNDTYAMGTLSRTGTAATYGFGGVFGAFYHAGNTVAISGKTSKVTLPVVNGATTINPVIGSAPASLPVTYRVRYTPSISNRTPVLDVQDGANNFNANIQNITGAGFDILRVANPTPSLQPASLRVKIGLPGYVSQEFGVDKGAYYDLNLGAVSFTPQTEYEDISGRGTAGNPFLLSHPMHFIALQQVYAGTTVANTPGSSQNYVQYLELFTENTASGTAAEQQSRIKGAGVRFALKNDIDLSAYNAAAPSAGLVYPTYTGVSFVGSLDGRSKTVKTDTALFPTLTGTAAVPIQIQDLTIDAAISASAAAGALANTSAGYVSAENCTVKGSIANTARTGGFIATASGPGIQITQSKSEAAIVCTGTGTQEIGGFIGLYTGADITATILTIADSAFSGTIQSAGNSAGGFIGYVASGGVVLTRCTAGGGIEAANYAGGLIGLNAGAAVSDTRINDCTVGQTATVVASTASAGGAVGYVAGRVYFNGITVRAAVSGKNPGGGDDVGGLVGTINDANALVELSGAADVRVSVDAIVSVNRGELVGRRAAGVFRLHVSYDIGGDTSVLYRLYNGSAALPAGSLSDITPTGLNIVLSQSAINYTEYSLCLYKYTAAEVTKSLVARDGGSIVGYALNLGAVALPVTSMIRGLGTEVSPFILAAPEHLTALQQVFAGTVGGGANDPDSYYSFLALFIELSGDYATKRNIVIAADTRFTLSADVDLTTLQGSAQWSLVPFTGIGTSAAPFRGVLDGGGHKITFNINNADTANAYVALFKYASGTTTYHAAIKNLKVDAVIRNTIAAPHTAVLVGTLPAAGFLDISNTEVNGTITIQTAGTAAGRVGGFVADNLGTLTVSDSKFTGSILSDMVSASHYVGGIVGYSAAAANTVRISGVTVEMTARVIDSGAFGGLIGYATNTGVGHLELLNGTVTIKNDALESKIGLESKTNTGGILGYTNSPNSVIDGFTVTVYATAGGSYIGGIVGQTIAAAANLQIKNGTVDGFLRALSYVGGVAGALAGTYTAANITVRTDLKATAGSAANVFVGGAVGQSSAAGTLDTVVFDAAVSLSGNYAGGLVGYHSAGALTIRSCAVKKNLTVSGNYVGGIAGLSAGAALTVTDTTVSGGVTGINYVGGMVGSSEYSLILDNAAGTGDVVGTSNVGGLAGRKIGYQLDVRTYFSHGRVSGATNWADLIGNNGTAAGYFVTFYYTYTSAQSPLVVNSYLNGALNATYFAAAAATDGPITYQYPAGVIDIKSRSMFFGKPGYNSLDKPTATGGVFHLTLGEITLPPLPDSMGAISGNGGQSSPFTLRHPIHLIALQQIIAGTATVNSMDDYNIYIPLFTDITGDTAAKRAAITAAGKIFAIGENIDMAAFGASASGKNYPVFTGLGSAAASSFKGSLDGQGYTVKYTIDAPSTNQTGLIRWANAGSEQIFKDIKLEGSVRGASEVGALIANAANKLTLVNVTSTVAATGTSYVGGLIGRTTAEISADGLNVNASVTATAQYAGGVAGHTSYAGAFTVNNSTVKGAISSTSPGNPAAVGGVLGYGSAAGVFSFDRLTTDLDITASGHTVGGAVGGFANVAVQLTVTNGNLNARILLRTLGSNYYYYGGVVGYVGTAIASLTVTDTAIGGSIKGRAYVGGVWGGGTAAAATLTRVTVNASVYAETTYAGGLIGYAQGTTLNIENCTVNGTVQANGGQVGGLAGRCDTATVTTASLTVNGNVQGGSSYTGGLVGYLYRSNLTVSGVTQINGIVTGTAYVGGLVGQFVNGNSGNYTLSISGAVTVASVTGTSNTSRTIGSVQYASLYVNLNFAYISDVAAMSIFLYNGETTQITTNLTTSTPGSIVYSIRAAGTVNIDSYMFRFISPGYATLRKPVRNGMTYTFDFGALDIQGTGMAYTITGLGTEASPFILTSPLHLLAMQQIYNDGSGTATAASSLYLALFVDKPGLTRAEVIAAGTYWKLNANIDMTAWKADPDSANYPAFLRIGDNASTHAFSGNFDGNGKTVTLNAAATAVGYGMFGYVVSSQSLTIANLTLKSTFSSTTNTAGALIGTLSANLTLGGIQADVTVGGGTYSIGGLIGSVSGGVTLNVQNSSVKVNITTTGYYIGGIAGINSGTVSTEDTTVNGSIVSNYSIGGIVGRNEAAGTVNTKTTTVTADLKSTNAGSGTNIGTGGVIGYNLGAATLETTKYKGAITVVYFGGGLIGRTNSAVTIRNCETEAKITATAHYAGGAIGYSSGVLDLDGFKTPAGAAVVIKGNQYVGGVVGYITVAATVKNVTLTVDLTGSGGFLGGIAGRCMAHTFTDITVSGSITGAGSYTGGVAGHIGAVGTITRAAVSANVYSSGSYVGGIAGYYGAANQITNIEDCAVSGNVTGATQVGGAVGNNPGHLVVRGLKVTGRVSGSSSIGGIVGQQARSNYTNYISLSLYGYFEIGGVAGASSTNSIIGYHANGALTFYMTYNAENNAVYSQLFNSTATVAHTNDYQTPVGHITFAGAGSRNLYANYYFLFDAVGFKRMTVPLFVGSVMNLDLTLPYEADLASVYIEGTGTASDPFKISTPIHLIALQQIFNYVGGAPTTAAAQSMNGWTPYARLFKDIGTVDPAMIRAQVIGYTNDPRYFRIDGNIDMKAWNMAAESKDYPYFYGIGLNNANFFTGVIDGNGKTITLDISGAKQYYGLIGFARDTQISNLTVDGQVISTGSYVGGFIGYFQQGALKLTKCVSKAYVKGTSYVSNLVGYMAASATDSKIDECRVEADHFSTSNYAGFMAGAVAASAYLEIRGGYVMGNSYYPTGAAAPSYSGGLVGRNYADANLKITILWKKDFPQNPTIEVWGLVTYNETGTDLKKHTLANTPAAPDWEISFHMEAANSTVKLSSFTVRFGGADDPIRRIRIDNRFNLDLGVVAAKESPSLTIITRERTLAAGQTTTPLLPFIKPTPDATDPNAFIYIDPGDFLSNEIVVSFSGDNVMGDLANGFHVDASAKGGTFVIKVTVTPAQGVQGPFVAFDETFLLTVYPNPDDIPTVNAASEYTLSLAERNKLDLGDVRNIAPVPGVSAPIVSGSTFLPTDYAVQYTYKQVDENGALVTDDDHPDGFDITSHILYLSEKGGVFNLTVRISSLYFQDVVGTTALTVHPFAGTPPAVSGSGQYETTLGVGETRVDLSQIIPVNPNSYNVPGAFTTVYTVTARNGDPFLDDDANPAGVTGDIFHADKTGGTYTGTVTFYSNYFDPVTQSFTLTVNPNAAPKPSLTQDTALYVLQPKNNAVLLSGVLDKYISGGGYNGTLYEISYDVLGRLNGGNLEALAAGEEFNGYSLITSYGGGVYRIQVTVSSEFFDDLVFTLTLTVLPTDQSPTVSPDTGTLTLTPTQIQIDVQSIIQIRNNGFTANDYKVEYLINGVSLGDDTIVGVSPKGGVLIVTVRFTSPDGYFPTYDNTFTLNILPFSSNTPSVSGFQSEVVLPARDFTVDLLSLLTLNDGDFANLYSISFVLTDIAGVDVDETGGLLTVPLTGGSCKVTVVLHALYGHFDNIMFGPYTLVIRPNPNTPDIVKSLNPYTLGAADETSVNLRTVFAIANGAYDPDDYTVTFYVDTVLNAAGVIDGIDPETFTGASYTVRIVFASAYFVGYEHTETLTVHAFSPQTPYLEDPSGAANVTYEYELPLKTDAVRIEDVIRVNDGAYFNRYTYAIVFKSGDAYTGFTNGVLTVPYAGGTYVFTITYTADNGEFAAYGEDFTLVVLPCSAAKPGVGANALEHAFGKTETDFDLNGLLVLDNGAYAASDYNYKIYVGGVQQSTVGRVSVDTQTDYKIVISSVYFDDIEAPLSVLLKYWRSDDTTITGIDVAYGSDTASAAQNADVVYSVLLNTEIRTFTVTPTGAHGGATVTVTGAAGGAVTFGPTELKRTISIRVLAENGVDERIYYLTLEIDPVVGITIDALSVQRTYELNEDISYTNLEAYKLLGSGTKVALAGTAYSVTTDFDKTAAGTYTVTVALTGTAFTQTYQVTVNPAPTVQDLLIDTSGVKTTYAVGDTLNLTGLLVKAYMSDHSLRDLTSGDYMVDDSAYDGTVAGPYTITVTAGAKSATFTVTVVSLNVTLADIIVDSGNVKKVYTVGDTLDLSGLAVTAIMSDMTTSVLAQGADGYTVENDYDGTVAGTYTVTIKAGAGAVSKTFSVEVREVAAIDDLIIDTSGVKKIYEVGDTLVTTGVAVKALRSDGTIVLLDSSKYNVNWSNVDMNTADIYEVTVTAGTVTATFNIMVKAVVIVVNLEADATGVKTSYALTETLDLSGLVVRITKSDGSTATLSESVGGSDGYEIDDRAFDASAAGTYDILVTYASLTSRFSVTVVPDMPLLPVGLTLDYSTMKLIYKIGEALDYTGLAVTIQYADGSGKVLSEAEYGINSAAYDNTRAGTYMLNVQVGNLSGSFNVIVIGVMEIQLDTTGIQLVYSIGESLNMSGLLVEALYSDFSVVTLGTGEYNVDQSAFNNTAAGTYPVTVTYTVGTGPSAKTFTRTYSVVVIPDASAPTVANLLLDYSAIRLIYDLSDSFDPTGLVVKAVYGDGSVVTLNASDYKLDDGLFDSTAEGTCTIWVRAYGFDVSFPVVVLDQNNPPATPIPVALLVDDGAVKKTYKFGESFDPLGLDVTLLTSDGVRTPLTAAEYILDDSAFQANAAGNYTIKITVDALTESFVVTVLPAPYAVDLVVNTASAKLNYLPGESLETGGLGVFAVMSDSSVVRLTTEYNVAGSAFDNTTAGSYTIRISYASFTFDYDVTVLFVQAYTVTFDTDGGSQAPAAQTVSENGYVVYVANPVKNGYRFLGWFATAGATAEWNFSTDTVTGNITLTARWENAAAVHTVTVTGGTGSGVYADGSAVTVRLSVPAGQRFTAWTATGIAVSALTDNGDGNYTFTLNGADVTLTAAYAAIPSYTVTFDTDGGSQAPTSQTVYENEYVVYVANPVKNGYRFLGWFATAGATAEWDFSTDAVTGNITLTARWENAAAVHTVTVTGGTGSGVYADGSAVTVRLSVPAGQRFTAWTATGIAVSALTDNGDGNYTFTLNGADVTLTAAYAAIPAYTVTFDTDGGSQAPTSQTVYENEYVVYVANPTRSGYRFLGWFAAAGATAEWDFSTDAVTGNITLTARWENAAAVHTVTVTGGTGSGIYADGTDVTARLSVPTGQRFTAWTATGIAVSALTDNGDGSYTFTLNGADVTLTAAYAAIPSYTVTFDTDGGSQAPAAQTVYENEYVVYVANPVKNGYRFLGWFAAAGAVTEWNFSTDAVTGNITLTAGWENTTAVYTVTVTGGTGSGIYADGTDVTAQLSVPTGQRFTVWTATGIAVSALTDNGDGSYTFTLNGADVTLTAAYAAIPAYTVTFDTDGDSQAPAAQTVYENEYVVYVANPAKDGYRFLGWFAAGAATEWNFSTDAVTENITLTARWEKVGASGGIWAIADYDWLPWSGGGLLLGIVVVIAYHAASRKRKAANRG